MAHVEDEHTPGPARGGAAVAEGRHDRGALKMRPREDGDPINPDEFKDLLDSYNNSFQNIAEGEVVKGTVLKVTASEVVVDVGYKSEGIIAVGEFLDESGQVTVEAGDIVDVLLERTEDREGYVVLSREKAEKMKIWDEVEKAYAERKVVIGRVIERIKGGLAVDIGVRAFLPGSQIDVRPVRNLDALRGQELRMSGKVVSLTDYGAFVELEPGVEGLIHVSEMSWSKRVKHPSKILNVGDTVETMVLGVDPGARRISLGLKQVESNPWHELSEKYPIGTTITGKVRNLTEFGAFVEVEEGIDGLIHISDMSWSKRLKHPSEALKKGDTVEAMVLNIDAENQRLSLGLKQLQTDIWDEFFQQHHVGDTVEGKIVRMTNFGAFVELAEGIEGLIHVSEFDDSTQKGKDGKLDLQVGETYQMKIIKLIPAERKIGLSIRALKNEEFRAD